jgi:hypothetical protein
LEEYDLLKCIDNGLEPFGSHVKQTIYWRMMILHGSQREAVVAQPAVFVNVLREILADSSIGIEKSIILEITHVFKLKAKDRESLARAIEAAREQIVAVTTEKVGPLSVAQSS